MKAEGAVSTAILLCADDKYAMYATVAAVSAVRASPGVDLEIFLWAIDWSADSHRRFERAARRHRLSVTAVDEDPSVLASLQTAYYVSKAGNGRLVMPAMLPDRVKRAVYLDSDMLVVGSLGPLVGLDLQQGAVIAAVQDAGFPTASAAPAAEALAVEGMDPQTVYFNSGMFLVDVEQWKQEDVFARVRSVVERHGGSLSHHDQDALNVIFHERRQVIDGAWNRQTLDLDGSRGVGRLRDDRIVHFTGRKPDDIRCDNPARRAYLSTLRVSGYFAAREYAVWRGSLERRRVLRQLRVLAHRLGLGKLRRRVGLR